MKCLIHCPGSEVGWIEDFFPGTPPYLLPIANKPYLEYLIDYCVLNGAERIVVVSDLPDHGVRALYGNGERWNVELSFQLSAPMTVDDLMPRLAKTLGDDDLLVLSGMFWLAYNQYGFTPVSIEPDRAERCGSHWRLIGRKLNIADGIPTAFTDLDPTEHKLSELASIGDFYRRSMTLVSGEADHYAMPTYNNTPNIYLGQNVSLARTAQLAEPVHLGNTVQIAEGVELGPRVIVGDNCFVDENTMIRNSVIQGNTYVGSDLEIDGKIIFRNTLINPLTGSRIDINDAFMLMPLLHRRRERRSPWLHQLGALLLMAAGLAPFLLLRPWLRLKREMLNFYASEDPEERIRLRVYVSRDRCGFLEQIFRKLSLDRFPLLGKVLRGGVRLVGHRPIPADAAHLEQLQRFQHYAPGLFSYSEMLAHTDDPLQAELDELYYDHHRCFRLNCTILFHTLMRNLLKEK